MLILNVTLCQQSADMRCDINLFKFGRSQLVNILDTVISSENISDTSFDHKMCKENLKYEVTSPENIKKIIIINEHERNP